MSRATGFRPTFPVLAVMLTFSIVAWKLATPYRLPVEDPKDERGRFATAMFDGSSKGKWSIDEIQRVGGGRKALLHRYELESRLRVIHTEFSRTSHGMLKTVLRIENASTDTARAAMFWQSRGAGVYNPNFGAYVPFRARLTSSLAPGARTTIADSAYAPKADFLPGGIAAELIAHPDSAAFRAVVGIFGSKSSNDTLTYVPLH